MTFHAPLLKGLRSGEEKLAPTSSAFSSMPRRGRLVLFEISPSTELLAYAALALVAYAVALLLLWLWL